MWPRRHTKQFLIKNWETNAGGWICLLLFELEWVALIFIILLIFLTLLSLAYFVKGQSFLWNWKTFSINVHKLLLALTLTLTSISTPKAVFPGSYLASPWVKILVVVNFVTLSARNNIWSNYTIVGQQPQQIVCGWQLDWSNGPDPSHRHSYFLVRHIKWHNDFLIICQIAFGWPLNLRYVSVWWPDYVRRTDRRTRPRIPKQPARQNSSVLDITWDFWHPVQCGVIKFLLLPPVSSYPQYFGHLKPRLLKSFWLNMLHKIGKINLGVVQNQ